MDATTRALSFVERAQAALAEQRAAEEERERKAAEQHAESYKEAVTEWCEHVLGEAPSDIRPELNEFSVGRELDFYAGLQDKKQSFLVDDNLFYCRLTTPRLIKDICEWCGQQLCAHTWIYKLADVALAMEEFPPEHDCECKPAQEPFSDSDGAEEPEPVEDESAELHYTESLDALMNRLDEQPNHIYATARLAIATEMALNHLRLHGLSEAEAAVQAAELTATGEAYANPEIVNGKNAEIRAYQLQAYLAQHAGLQRARAELQAAHDEVATKEYELACQRIQLDYERNEMEAIKRLCLLKVQAERRLLEDGVSYC